MYFWYSVKNLLPYAGSSTALRGVVPSILSTAEASRCSGATPDGGSSGCCCGGGGGGHHFIIALVEAVVQGWHLVPALQAAAVQAAALLVRLLLLGALLAKPRVSKLSYGVHMDHLAMSRV